VDKYHENKRKVGATLNEIEQLRQVGIAVNKIKYRHKFGEPNREYMANWAYFFFIFLLIERGIVMGIFDVVLSLKSMSHAFITGIQHGWTYEPARDRLKEEQKIAEHDQNRITKQIAIRSRIYLGLLGITMQRAKKKKHIGRKH
jgi:hypothetical protein